jgi:hypothetical protein
MSGKFSPVIQWLLPASRHVATSFVQVQYVTAYLTQIWISKFKKNRMFEYFFENTNKSPRSAAIFRLWEFNGFE